MWFWRLWYNSALEKNVAIAVLVCNHRQATGIDQTLRKPELTFLIVEEYRQREKNLSMCPQFKGAQSQMEVLLSQDRHLHHKEGQRKDNKPASTHKEFFLKELVSKKNGTEQTVKKSQVLSWYLSDWELDLQTLSGNTRVSFKIWQPPPWRLWLSHHCCRACNERKVKAIPERVNSASLLTPN